MLDFDFTVGTLYTALSGERRPPPIHSVLIVADSSASALNVMIFFSIMLIQLNTPCLIFSTGVHTRPHAQIITRLWIKIGMARLKDKNSSRRLLSHIFEKGLYNMF
jgi:hypothetical protein